MLIGGDIQRPTVPRFHRLIREVGNIHSQLNTKGDMFTTKPERMWQFAFSHGVRVEGNFTMFQANISNPA